MSQSQATKLFFQLHRHSLPSATLLTLMAIGLTLFSPAPTHAQTSASSAQIDLSLFPSSTYIWVKPGEKKTLGFTLTQRGNLNLTVTPRLVDFRPSSETGEPILQSSASITYVQPSGPVTEFGKPYSVGARGSQQLLLEIAPPADALTGEYHLTLLLNSEPDRQLTLGSAGSTSSAIIGSNLIILVSPTQPATTGHLEIAEFNAPGVLDSFWPLEMQLVLSNPDPEAHLVHGQISITDWRDQTVSTYELYPDLVLAQSQRQVRVLTAEKQPGPLRYNPGWLLGPLTVTVTIPQPNAQLTVSYRVLALPFVLGGLFVLILASILGYWWLNKRKYLLQKLFQQASLSRGTLG